MTQSPNDPPLDEPGKPPPAEIEYPPPHHPPSPGEPVTPILPGPANDPDSPGGALVRGDEDLPEPNEPG